jgi:alpha,alpha-trehalose phosphorylase
LRATKPEAYAALVDKTALGDAEVEAWARAAKDMFVPYEETLQIIPQDDNFLEGEPWDFKNTPEDHYPLLLFYHPLDIYRKQVIKQADVVLALFLLGDAYSEQEKRRNFEFYDPLTTGDSSLSSCVEAIIAAQCGDMEKATEYALAALLMDLDDIGGNVKNGCHIASMGGTWMVFAYGFGGLRDHDGILSFRPRRAPEMTGLLRFPLTYRGQVLEVEIGTETVEYTLREGESLVIHHEAEEVRLTRDQPKAIRQVGRW